MIGVKATRYMATLLQINSVQTEDPWGGGGSRGVIMHTAHTAYYSRQTLGVSEIFCGTSDLGPILLVGSLGGPWDLGSQRSVSPRAECAEYSLQVLEIVIVLYCVASPCTPAARRNGADRF